MLWQATAGLAATGMRRSAGSPGLLGHPSDAQKKLDWDMGNSKRRQGKPRRNGERKAREVAGKAGRPGVVVETTNGAQ